MAHKGVAGSGSVSRASEDSDCRNPPQKLRSPGSESSGSQGCSGLRLPKFLSPTSEFWVEVQSFRGLRLPKSASKGFLGRRCECPTRTLAGSHAPRDRCFMAAAPSHHNSADQSLGRNPLAFATRLRQCCAEVNSSLDVDGLCRDFPSRIQKLVDKKGGRLA